MLGAIIGDIAGSRFEHHNRKSKKFTLLNKECRVTDDSVMTLAIAKAILSCDGDYSNLAEQAVVCMQELGRRYPHAGYGGSFRQWLRQEAPQPYGSYGNGSAMRVSPCAYAAATLDEALRFAEITASVTHDHPDGICGAKAIAGAIFLARHGADKEEIEKFVEENCYPLDFTLDKIRSSYSFDVSCKGSVPQAIEAFLESTDFEDAIRSAVSVGGDSDTIASMTGAIAEAYYGLPYNISKQARSYLDKFQIDILKQFQERYGKPWSSVEDKEKPSLKMADGAQVRSLQELRLHFDLISVLEHYTSGELLAWLLALNCTEEAKIIGAIDSTIDDFEATVCAALRVPFSMKDAVQLFTGAAERDCAEAQFRLGCFYMFGDGVEEDEKKGAALIRRAAEQGHIEAQNEMGILYTRGCGVEYDEDKGKEWFMKAAEQGYAESQYSLGVYYTSGVDGELDSEEAVKWFLKAAGQGHMEAEYSLGFHFQYGDGVDCNPEEAVRRYRLAAGMGHTGAQCKLGLCYLLGEGVEQNDSEAVKWLVKAAKQGYSEAVDTLDSLGYFDEEDTTSES